MTAPLKLAIVGSGPSAFYAATRVLAAAAAPGASSAAVHVYERLPTPFGLVRAGVAPDHPDVKNVVHRFTEAVRASAAADSRAGLRFFGNVRVVAGPSSSSSSSSTEVELPLGELLAHYSHVVLAYGAAQARVLGRGVGGQELRGVCSALDLVNWYNGHPDAYSSSSSGHAPWLDVVRPGARHVSVVGAGNVALDVARILLRARAPTSAFLARTDIPAPVLAHLSRTDIEHVSIVARRGVAQAAFTNKEVREMLTLGETEGIALVPLSRAAGERAREDVARLQQLADAAAQRLRESNGDAAKEGLARQAADLAGELRIRKRLVELLIKGSKAPKPDAAGHSKSWNIDSFRAPEAILPSPSGGEGAFVGQVRWAVTEPTHACSSSSQPLSPAPTGPAQTPTWGGGGGIGASTAPEPEWGAVRKTDARVTTDTDAVVYSLGYVGAPLPLPSGGGVDPAWQALIPFDARRGVVQNEKGVVEYSAEAVDRLGLDRAQLPQLHTTGWIGRGPVGVIASTMYDAYDTVDLMLARASSSSCEHLPHPSAPPPLVTARLLSASLSAEQRRRALTPAARATEEDVLRVDGLGGRVVEWADWEVLDEAERAAGAGHGPPPKEREKIIAFG